MGIQTETFFPKRVCNISMNYSVNLKRMDFTSIKDLSKKCYTLENMYLSLYISGYFDQ
jgi:hypothetical protein